MGWWLLRLWAKILAFYGYWLIFFSYGNNKVKINFFCFKELNINKPVFFCIYKAK